MERLLKRTKIVCTIGPACEDKDTIRKMIESGMNVARLNFSHGNHEEHKKRIDIIREVSGELGVYIAILLDTKGPEIRTKKFDKDEIYLKEGETFTITTRDIVGSDEISSVTYEGLADDVSVGDRILVDDGLICLEVENIEGTEIVCQVKNSGTIKNNKGINIPGVAINLPSITDKDKEDILFAIKNNVDFIAVSFVRKRQDIMEIKRILEENNTNDIDIIAKIENQEGVDNLLEIIQISEGVMVARGDLGVEIPPEEIPLIQKRIIRECNSVGKPVITATQMLDSMMRNPRPTRAEVTDVASAIFDGTDAIMLSGETAAGKYPVESVITMATIAKKTEASLDYQKILKQKSREKNTTITDAISQATYRSAEDLGAKSIFAATSSGYTAKMISKFRPIVPIVATTSSEKVARKMALVWGITPMVIDNLKDISDIFEDSKKKALEEGFIEYGDLIVLTAGVPVGISGSTNMLRVDVVSKILIKGIGIGSRHAVGHVCIVSNAKEAEEKMKKGDILVSHGTDSDMVPYMKKASALIVEEAGLTCHTAIVGLNLNIPTIVGAENATTILKDGMCITVDTAAGIIYKGRATII
ncbi:MAG: pyruvate kinase [Peptostreptococcales bacterium]